jgi:hypothetical protein
MKIRKQILAPGTYWTGTGPVEFTTEDIRALYATGRAMLAAGISVPVPLEHQANCTPLSQAERAARSVSHNCGFVESWEIAADGSLNAVLDVSYLPGAKDDADIRQRLEKTIKYVSPEIRPSFTDGTGRTWENVIGHVALTPIPVWAGQRPFGAANNVPAVAMSAFPRARAWRELSGAPIRFARPTAEEMCELLLSDDLDRLRAVQDELKSESPPGNWDAELDGCLFILASRIEELEIESGARQEKPPEPYPQSWS